jgi:hypothetical protein
MKSSDKGQVFGKRASVKGTRLSVSPNKRHLVDQSGNPFFYLADTAWTLFKRLDHDDVDRYFNNRVSKGFTVIQAYVLRGLSVKNLYGDVPLVGNDPTKLDPGFFGNIDYIVNRANELGLVPGLVTTLGEHVRKKEKTGERFKQNEEIFNSANAFEYGRLLGERYKKHCVIWLLGGDRQPSNEDVVVWDAMGRGLKAGCDGVHLVSYHSGGGSSSSVWFHNHAWLDFNTIQSLHCSADPNYKLVEKDYALTPVKPTLDMEARYESHPDRNNMSVRMDAHQAREAAYWALLSGAAGHGYGCNDIWQMADDTKIESTLDYSFPLLPPTTNWYVAMDLDGAFGIKFIRKLLELRPWHTMIPDQSVIDAGQGDGENHIQAARAEDGSFLLAYSPMGSSISIHMDRVRGKTVKAQWYNPRLGVFTLIGEYANTGVRVFGTPFQGATHDWVLVLEDSGKRYSNELKE